MNKKDLFLLLIQTGAILRVLQDSRSWRVAVYAIAEIAGLPEDRLPNDPEQIAEMAIDWVNYDLCSGREHPEPPSWSEYERTEDDRRDHLPVSPS